MTSDRAVLIKAVFYPRFGFVVAVYFAFDSVVVDEFKAKFRGHIRWDWQRKAWLIAAHEDEIVRFFSERGYSPIFNQDGFFDDMSAASSPRSRKPTSEKPSTDTAEPAPASADVFSRKHATDEDFRLLHLRSSAPLAVARAAFKVLAQECHPDRGGDVGYFQTLNAAMQRIERARKT